MIAQIDADYSMITGNHAGQTTQITERTKHTVHQNNRRTTTL